VNGQGWVEDWTHLIDHLDELPPPLPIDSDSSPQLTPDSIDSQLSRDSDVGQLDRLKINLQVGPEDHSMDFLIRPDLDFGNLTVNSGKDDSGEGEEGKMTEDAMDWSDDVTDWDSLFGVNGIA
jgi:hypothetical protein